MPSTLVLFLYKIKKIANYADIFVHLNNKQILSYVLLNLDLKLYESLLIVLFRTVILYKIIIMLNAGVFASMLMKNRNACRKMILSYGIQVNALVVVEKSKNAAQDSFLTTNLAGNFHSLFLKTYKTTLLYIL